MSVQSTTPVLAVLWQRGRSGAAFIWMRAGQFRPASDAEKVRIFQEAITYAAGVGSSCYLEFPAEHSADQPFCVQLEEAN